MEALLGLITGCFIMAHRSNGAYLWGLQLPLGRHNYTHRAIPQSRAHVQLRLGTECGPIVGISHALTLWGRGF